jgi:hypothetical protein
VSRVSSADKVVGDDPPVRFQQDGHPVAPHEQRIVELFADHPFDNALTVLTLCTVSVSCALSN